LSFLERHLSASAPRLALAGLYGLERSGFAEDNGLEPKEADLWRARVGAAVREAREELPAGVRLEDKGLALALHYRQVPERALEVGRLAETLAKRHGLRAKPAKLAIELVPAISLDKGTVAAELARGRAVACFLGDDAGDLAAFEALAAMAARGELACALRIAIAGAETPPALLEAADLVLDGPRAALGFLEELAERLGRTPPS
jgi:trehalose 6-phosphate phosphatase